MKFRYNGKDFNIKGTSEEDHIYRRICEGSTFYEIDLLEYAAKFMKERSAKNSIAIDVGANIGNHSIFIQSFLAEYLIAVEPNPDTLPTLKSNLSENIGNYTIYENGLGESTSRGNIVLPDGAANNIGMAKLNLDGGDVDIITLDSMVEDWQSNNDEKGQITLIKIDVEGMELSVLKGAQKTIEKYQPHLLLEAATPSEFLSLKGFLKEIGYTPLRHYAGTPVYHFSYKPTRWVIFQARMVQVILNIKRKIRRKSRKLKRLLSS